jgi:hypothetical protein
MEGLKAARDPDRPMVRRISKVQKRLDALTEATWESESRHTEA